MHNDWKTINLYVKACCLSYRLEDLSTQIFSEGIYAAWTSVYYYSKCAHCIHSNRHTKNSCWKLVKALSFTLSYHSGGMENLDSFPITFPYLAPQKSGNEVREV